MASFADDITRIRNVLQANAVNNKVDDDMLGALLSLYESDNQRVDLVVLDLEDMLGKELSVGAQQARWDELQKPPSNRDGVKVHQFNNNNLPAAEAPENPMEEVIVLDAPTPSTSRQTGVQLPTFRNKRHLSYASTQSSSAKRRTPSKEDVSQTVTTDLAQKRVDQERGFAASNDTKGIIKVVRFEDDAHDQQIVASTSQVSLTHVPSTSADDPSDSKERIQIRSMAFHQKILNTIPDINIKFAAFKATEYTMLNKSTSQLEEYLREAVRDPILPRGGTTWDQLEAADSSEPEKQQLALNVYNKFLKEQSDFLARTIPDADPEFLEENVKNFQGDQELIRNFVTEILEGNTKYPTRGEYNKRKEQTELVNKFFTVDEFFELYDDPLKHFRDDARVTDRAYHEEALNQLKLDFRFTGLTHIRKIFAKNNNHYAPTYLELKAAPLISQRKTKRNANECFGITTKDLFLLQEIAFVTHLEDIFAYQRNKEQMRSDAVAHCRASGTLLDCPICCEDELIDDDLIYCPMGHGVCKNCVRRQTEELIGLMKNHVPCLSPDCSSEYSVNDLKLVLNKSTFHRFEKRRQAEEVLAAGIDGLESCPFCEYCEVPPETERLFRCQNPECSKISCRQCRELNHAPLRCEEVAMKQRLHNYVETKMTEALMRQCPACKRNFVKADGCNKMVCVCGAIMCYVCRQQIKDYHHFSNNNHPNQPAPVNPVKCPLYCDTEKLHKDEVDKSAAKARAELASSNPNIRVDLVLGGK